MAKKQKSLHELRKVFTEMDAKTRQAEQDVAMIQQFIERFQAMEENRQVLEAYYQEEWMEDIDAFDQLQEQAQAEGKVSASEDNFYCTNQDAIWNALQDLYVERVRLLKLLAEAL